MNGTRFGCLTCPSNLLFYNNQCLNPCPNGTYASGGECIPCVYPCNTCLSFSQCLSCVPHMYLIIGTTTCVDNVHCPMGFTADDATWTCKACYFACRTCNGPTIHDCIICNFLLGYGRGPAGGDCLMMICTNSMFLDIDIVANKAYCKNCYKSCATCSDYGPNNCISCNPGYQAYPSPIANRVQCLTCADMNTGYYALPDGTCKEICGDGIDLGQVECDDGNLINGDGCSTDCKIEYGFECHRRTGLPDICVNVIPPHATLTVSKGNVLVITFSEKVYILSNSILTIFNVK